MIEKNRDILSNAIRDMGRRSPGASDWDHIADQLDQLEAAAFAEKAGQHMPAYKAPEGSWEKIAAKLPPASPPFWSGIAGKIIAGLLVVGTAALVYLYIPSGENKNAEQTYSNTETLIPEVPPQNEPVILPENITVEATLAAQTSPVHKETQTTTIIATALKNQETILHEEIPVKEEQTSEIRQTRTILFLKPVATFSLPAQEPNREILSQREEPEKEQLTPEYFDDRRFKLRYKAGAYYAYKHFQQFEEEGMQVPRNFSSGGFDLVIEKNRWSLKTGVEYSGWTEKGDYFFDYKQNQLVYQYNYVDSAFINTNSGEVTYYTTEREVFDSVPGQVSDETSSQYRILQIPLLIGYRIFDRGRFSINIIGGVGFDIRLSGKQFIPVFDREDANLEEVRNTLLYRTGNNWRIIAGLEADYRFGKNWEFYLEPSYQQYMKPFYAPEDTKGLGLFKIKAGLHFLF